MYNLLCIPLTRFLCIKYMYVYICVCTWLYRNLTKLLYLTKNDIFFLRLHGYATVVCCCVPIQHYPVSMHHVVSVVTVSWGGVIHVTMLHNLALLHVCSYLGHFLTRNRRLFSELVNLRSAPSRERYPCQTSLAYLLCSTMSSCRPKHRSTSMWVFLPYMAWDAVDWCSAYLGFFSLVYHVGSSGWDDF